MNDLFVAQSVKFDAYTRVARAVRKPGSKPLVAVSPGNPARAHVTGRTCCCATLPVGHKKTEPLWDCFQNTVCQRSLWVAVPGNTFTRYPKSRSTSLGNVDGAKQ